MNQTNEKKHTLLLVDDEKSNLLVLADILSPYHNILMAKSGARALELAGDNTPDLILLDVIMPEMSGFEVIKRLKDAKDTTEIPVIFITGLSDTDSEEKGLSLGAVDYIAKPFNRAIVKARVETHLKIVEQMRMIERLCLVDPLTTIANRRDFENRMGVEWYRALRIPLPLSIFMLDIDHFKKYNDTYGHPQGDVALKAVAQSLTATLRRSSDFAARWGGEEFIGLLPSLDDPKSALEIAEQIRENVAALLIPTSDGNITTLTASIGLYTAVPSIESCAENFIKKADDALYQAKLAGRNRVVSAED
ncbi:MAG: diguanylate cyclase [Firmicutes bacterium]|nr:diguanylate cyclase [Bacillota bacterium]